MLEVESQYIVMVCWDFYICFAAKEREILLVYFILCVNVNYIFKKKRNLMFRKNGIIFFRIFYESLEACDSQFAIL